MKPFTKEKPIVYKNESIKVDGNIVSFDGKYFPDKQILRAYRYYGDINISKKAFETFIRGLGAVGKVELQTGFGIY